MRWSLKCWIGMLLCVVFWSNGTAAPVRWDNNGHYYEAVSVPEGILWTDASNAATAAGGYLASITSPEENAFVYSLVDADVYWHISGVPSVDGPWLGGFQLDGSPEPGADWHWVTGEPFSYTNWNSFQPDNSGGTQDRLHFYGRGTSIADRAPTWDDAAEEGNGYFGYVVEYPASNRHPLWTDAVFDFSIEHDPGPFALETDNDGNIYSSELPTATVQIFDPDGNFQRHFGETGTGDGQFDFPLGISINSLGHIIVTDEHNHRVQVFDEDGGFLFKFGSNGADDGAFHSPLGVAVDAADNIYVTDRGNNRVQVFNNAGEHQLTIGSLGSNPGQFDHPRGIAINSVGNIVVGDTHNDRVQVFDSNGIFKFSVGERGTDEGQFTMITDVATDDSDNIFVATGDSVNERVQVFDSSGEFLYSFGSFGTGDGEFNSINGIDLDEDRGRIVIGDGRNGRIQVFRLIPIGDVNMDGEVNGLDVNPFLAHILLADDNRQADMNQDGEVNGLDVEPFVDAVLGGGGVQAVPEPSTLLLCIIALVVVGGLRWFF